MTLEELNRASDEDATQRLLACCGSERWASQMLRHRPFESVNVLHRCANEVWTSLSALDMLEAFSQHPQIGGAATSKWSTEEQQGMSHAQQETTDAILELNARYQRQFGYIFIVCATGKSAEEMHSVLEQRLCNEPEHELPVAAEEQAKIMHLRLDKLLTA